MYEAHGKLRAPAFDETIWRYMDFTKFVSMIDTASLWFTRLDKMEDRFEGRYTTANYQDLLAIEKQLSEESKTEITDIASSVIKLNERFRSEFLISCWHLSSHESAAMWKLYLQTNEGIAVRSTFERFVNCLRPSDEKVFVGKVNYIDYQKDKVPQGNAFFPVVHKRKSFSFENELRAIIWRPGPSAVPRSEVRVALSGPSRDTGRGNQGGLSRCKRSISFVLRMRNDRRYMRWSRS